MFSDHFKYSLYSKHWEFKFILKYQTILEWAFSLLNVYKIIKISRNTTLFILNGEFLPFVFLTLLVSKLIGIKVYLVWHDVVPHPGKKINILLNYLSYISVILSRNVNDINKLIINMRDYFLNFDVEPVMDDAISMRMSLYELTY